ncbi:MAG: glycosyltransferase family 39 protein [Caldilineaceae bacterium]
MTPTRTQTAGLRITLLLILLAAFALHLHELTRQNIWWDEARNIDVALRPLTQIASAPELDIQPPLYFWLLHGWATLTGLALKNGPITLAFFLRFVSVVASVISTALLYQLGRLTFSPTAGLYAAALALLSPFWLAESQETRMYTVSLALLIGAAVALVRATRDRRSETGDSLIWSLVSDLRSLITHHSSLITFILLSALNLYNHYNAIFILVAWYAWWGVWALGQADRWRQLRRIVLTGVAMTLLILPLAPIARRQIPDYANPNLVIPTVWDYLRQNWQGHLGGYAFEPAMLGGYGVAWLWAVLGVAVVGLGLALALLVAKGRRASTLHSHAERGNEDSALRTPHSAFLLVWLFGGLGLYYIAVLERGAFNIRYTIFVTPALYVLIAIGLAGWSRWWRPLGVIGLAVVAVGMIPAAYADLYDPRFGREDITGVTQWLRQHAQRGDVVLVDQKYPFGFYYQRYTIDSTVSPQGPEPAPARYLFVDINTLDQTLNRWAGKTKHVFWVQWFESDTDPRHAVHFLLDKAGQHSGEQDFHGYSIEWWTLKPPNHFELAARFTGLNVGFFQAAHTVEISLPDEPVALGGHLPVVIRWQRMADIPNKRPLKVRVALYDQNNARLTQADERLLNDRHVMPHEWRLTDRPLNVYMLDAPDNLAAGEYELRVLVYDANTLEPVALVDQANQSNGQEAVVGKIRIAKK